MITICGKPSVAFGHTCCFLPTLKIVTYIVINVVKMVIMASFRLTCRLTSNRLLPLPIPRILNSRCMSSTNANMTAYCCGQFKMTVKSRVRRQSPLTPAVKTPVSPEGEVLEKKAIPPPNYPSMGTTS